MIMKSVAVIGANGYVGRAICDALYLNNINPDRKYTFGVFEVTRDNYEGKRKERITNPSTPYQVLINCAMPGKRLWANINPEKDYIETVEKTKELLTTWSYNQFINISTISARCESDTTYGHNRLESEKLCQAKSNNSLIVRLTAMYSDNISRGALVDIVNNRKVYVNENSRYSFTPLKFVGTWIANNIDRTGLIELGAKNTISLKEIVAHLGLTIEFGERVDIQEIANPESDFPDAKDILPFMERLLKQHTERKNENK